MTAGSFCFFPSSRPIRLPKWSKRDLRPASSIHFLTRSMPSLYSSDNASLHTPVWPTLPISASSARRPDRRSLLIVRFILNISFLFLHEEYCGDCQCHAKCDLYE